MSVNHNVCYYYFPEAMPLGKIKVRSITQAIEGFFSRFV